MKPVLIHHIQKHYLEFSQSLLRAVLFAALYHQTIHLITSRACTAPNPNLQLHTTFFTYINTHLNQQKAVNMAPLTVTWNHPSHPNIQEVHIKLGNYATFSVSKVSLAPFEVFAKLDFPPCTKADKPTYATVQMGAVSENIAAPMCHH